MTVLVEQLRIDERTSRMVDAYLQLLRIPYKSEERELARPAMTFLCEELSKATGYPPEDVHIACFVVGAH